MASTHAPASGSAAAAAALAKVPVGLILGLPKPLDGDINIGYQIETAATVTFLFAFFAVSLRVAARWKYSKLGWDDYLMVFAIIQALLATISDYVACNWGLGRHLYFLTITQASNQQLWQYIAQTFCLNALTCGKVSLCLSYLRVMRGSHNSYLRWSLYLAAGLTTIINTLVIIAQFTQCIPAQKSWNPFIQGTCWQSPSQISLVLLQGAFSALTDFFLSAFPFVLFSKLQVSRQSKNILLVLMSLGVVTGIFATVRTIEAGLTLHSAAAPDLSFNSIPGLMWAGMERNIALMISSIPPIRPLALPIVSNISKSFSSRFSTSRTGNSSKPSQGQNYELSHGSEKVSQYMHSKRKAPPNTFITSTKNSVTTNNTTLVSGTGSQDNMLPIQRNYDRNMV